MTARFPALCDDGMDPGSCEHLCFCDRGCGAQDHNPCRLQRRERVGIGNAEMEAHHGRAQFEHQGELGVIEPGAKRWQLRWRLSETEAAIPGPQALARSLQRGGVRCRGRVSKEIDIEGQVCARAHGAGHTPQLIGG
jgi:hypothetical protein